MRLMNEKIFYCSQKHESNKLNALNVTDFTSKSFVDVPNIFTYISTFRMKRLLLLSLDKTHFLFHVHK